MSPEKGPFLKESFSSNHQFLGGYVSYQGVRSLKTPGTTVDGGNPAPSGMYITLFSHGINYQTIDWLAGFLNHQQ